MAMREKAEVEIMPQDLLLNVPIKAGYDFTKQMSPVSLEHQGGKT